MSYNPTTDFLSLLRQTSGGVRTERMPGLDYVVVALARAGLIILAVQANPPTTNQATTAWFQPAVPSWSHEGTLFLWNATNSEYEIATPALWSALLAPTTGPEPVVQDVVTAGPVVVQTNATVVRVQNVGAPVALTVPLSANMESDVLISDYANGAGAHPITVTLSGGDVFPGGVGVWTIGADAGSIYLRRVPGGFAL
jgi:hypothetical protein